MRPALHFPLELPPPPRVSARTAYACALAAPLVACVLQLALRPAVYQAPFILFFLGVAAVAWLGGMGPGLVCLLGSTLLAGYFFVAPINAASFNPGGELATGLFVVVGILLCLLNGSLRARDGERMRLLEQLASERQRLQAVLMQAPAFTFVVEGPEHRFTMANARFCELVGCADLVGRTAREGMPAYAEQYALLFDQVRRTGRAFTGEEVATPMLRPDGTVEERYFNFTLQPVRDAAGEVVAIANFGFDVTEQVRGRQRAEALAASLRESEEQLRFFVDRAGVAMGQTEAVTGRVVRVNAAFCALTGYPEEELLGRSFLELTHPADREEDQEHYRRMVRGELARFEREKRFLCKDGTVRWVQVTGSLVHGPDGRPVRTAAVMQDVTERKAAEAARAAGEALLRLVTDALPVLVGYVDRSLRYRSANFAYGEWFGVPPTDVVGRTLEELMGPEAFALVRGQVEAVLAGEAQRFELEVPYRTGTRHVRASYIPHHGLSGEVEGFVVLVTDVSDEMRLLRERTRLLQEAEAAVRVRDEFLSVASHELRTPVTSLTLQLQLLARALPPDSRERTRLATAERQLSRLRSLVESLLDVSRIREGQLELQPAEADLVQLTREALERLEPVFAQAGSPVYVEAFPETVRGRWDVQRVDQVLVNLLSNAAKYGAQRPVHVAVRQEGARALLRVADEGIGIPPEVLPRLFGRFERGVSERHYGGLGLGLYISRQLVEAMGGSIRVQSEAGKGTAFTVELPLEPPQGQVVPST